jgi:diadenosine tetraphosphatase ApaH/serine/threonine PP2A family protein phosphatase
MIETLPSSLCAIDLIGDVHGEIHELTGLLALLGYTCRGSNWTGPSGRRLVFVGDLIDRGPGIRETVTFVRSLHEQGLAHVCMGNHEYNALCSAAPAPEGGFLRSEEKTKKGGHLSTLKAFSAAQNEWQSHLRWFATLPLAIELPGRLRVVHACWDPALLAMATKLPALTHETLVAIERTPELKTMQQILLCGPEMALPEGSHITDFHGNVRSEVRYRWYRAPEPGSLHEISFPPHTAAGVEPFNPKDAGMGDGYPLHAPPVAIGHYALGGAPAPLAPNVACIDYGASKKGRLTAYRWDGEPHFHPGKFLQAPAAATKP